MQRFEMKYLISDHVALAVRDFVGSYLVLDEYSLGKPNNSYQIHSLYLDSDDLCIYWDVVNGAKNRYKLRLRYYDDCPGSPVFLEIKRRIDNAILKQRSPVRREAVPALLAGEPPGPTHLLSNKPQYLVAAQRFSQMMIDNRLTCKARVSYFREAWVSAEDNSVRVTLDREVGSMPLFTHELSTQLENSAMPWGRQVILELKFTGRFPEWFGELVRCFGVTRSGVAKYAEGVAMTGEWHFSGEFAPPERADRVEKFLRRRRLAACGAGAA